MPRPIRNIVPGFPYHLAHRGNNKQEIFQSDDDRRIYLYWFEEARAQHGMKVLSYCLMGNHVHFVAIAEHKDSFAKVIAVTHSRYAAYFNQKYGNVGHLWQGRYYSDFLKGKHFIAAIRYVERNPVRACLSHKPWDWIWSSAKEHVGSGKGIVLLENIKSYVDVPSWQEFIDQPDEDEYLNYIKQTHSKGRPKKKGV